MAPINKQQVIQVILNSKGHLKIVREASICLAKTNCVPGNQRDVNLSTKQPMWAVLKYNSNVISGTVYEFLNKSVEQFMNVAIARDPVE